MKTTLNGIDYIDRYNFQRGKIDYLPKDESGMNALLMAHKQIMEEQQKRIQEQRDKEKIVIEQKNLKKFEEQVAEEITKEIEKILK